ncbi:MAG TPA: thioesterase family protein [Myxococcales bacterium]|nr:thioesterase family protein [Myxococcales bacterium]
MTEPRPGIEAAFRFTHGHRVRYDEVDAQGIVGNATWLNLLQLGRIEYLRYLGILLEGGTRSPVQAVVRQAAIEYLAPARFDDPLSIKVRTAYMGTRSSRIEYIVDNVDTRLRCVVGQTVLVCVEMATLRSMPWPQIWRDRISEFEGENLSTSRD